MNGPSVARSQDDIDEVCGGVVASVVIEVADSGRRQDTVPPSPKAALCRKLGSASMLAPRQKKSNSVASRSPHLSVSRPTLTSTSFMPASTYNDEYTMNHEHQHLGQYRYGVSQPTNLVFKTASWAHRSHITSDWATNPWWLEG